VDHAALDLLVGSLFEFLCERRVGELVDTAQVMAALDQAVTPERVGRLNARFVTPARERLIARARASALLLGAWLPEPVKQAIGDFLGRPVRLPKKLVEELVASDKVREQVRATLQEAMTGVIQKAFTSTPGGGALRGAIGLGARVAGAASRGLFGGLGAEVQRQLEERVKDVVDASVGVVQRRIAERLLAEETARSLGRRRKQAFLELLSRSEKETGELLAEGPWPLLDGLSPVVVPWNLQRPEVREAVRAEIDAVLAELSKQTVGELLDELGLRALARQGFADKLGPLARAFVASAHFKRG